MKILNLMGSASVFIEILNKNTRMKPEIKALFLNRALSQDRVTFLLNLDKLYVQMKDIPKKEAFILLHGLKLIHDLNHNDKALTHHFSATDANDRIELRALIKKTIQENVTALSTGLSPTRLANVKEHFKTTERLILGNPSWRTSTERVQELLTKAMQDKEIYAFFRPRSFNETLGLFGNKPAQNEAVSGEKTATEPTKKVIQYSSTVLHSILRDMSRQDEKVVEAVVNGSISLTQ